MTDLRDAVIEEISKMPDVVEPEPEVPVVGREERLRAMQAQATMIRGLVDGLLVQIRSALDAPVTPPVAEAAQCPPHPPAAIRDVSTFGTDGRTLSCLRCGAVWTE